MVFFKEVLQRSYFEVRGEWEGQNLLIHVSNENHDYYYFHDQAINGSKQRIKNTLSYKEHPSKRYVNTRGDMPNYIKYIVKSSSHKRE